MSPLDRAGDLDRAVEVIVCYGDTIVDVAHVRLAAGARAGYTIGERSDANFTTSGEGLPTPELFSLVHVSASPPGFAFAFGAAMEGTLITASERTSLAELADREGATQLADCVCHPLAPGMRVVLQPGPGPLRVYLRNVADEQPVHARRPLDRLWWGCASTSALAAVVGLLLLLCLPPERLEFDTGPGLERFLPVPPLVRAEPESEIAPGEEVEAGFGGQAVRGEQMRPARVTRGQLEAGSRGGHASPRAARRAALLEQRVREQPSVLGRDSMLPGVSNAGVLGLTAPYMQRFADMGLGAYTPENDDRELWESMTGGEVGNYGVGGLTVSDVVSRLGSHAEQTIGFGSNYGLIGAHGYQSASFCNHACRRRQNFYGRPRHEVRLLGTSATNRSSVDMVRRIIRAHRNEFRGCYNAALVEGTVPLGRTTYVFAISGEGKVLASAVESSTHGDPSLDRCITKAIKGWHFPRLGGIQEIQQALEFVQD